MLGSDTGNSTSLNFIEELQIKQKLLVAQLKLEFLLLSLYCMFEYFSQLNNIFSKLMKLPVIHIIPVM